MGQVVLQKSIPDSLESSSCEHYIDPSRSTSITCKPTSWTFTYRVDISPGMCAVLTRFEVRNCLGLFTLGTTRSCQQHDEYFSPCQTSSDETRPNSCAITQHSTVNTSPINETEQDCLSKFNCAFRVGTCANCLLPGS